MIQPRRARPAVRTLLITSITTATGATMLLTAPTASAEPANAPHTKTGSYINVPKSQVIVPPRPRFAMKRNAAFLIGDSLTFQAYVGGRMASRTKNHRLAHLGVEAIGGITTKRMLDRLTRQKYFPQLPKHVVVALGSNDVWSGTPPEQFRSHLSQLLAQLHRPRQPRNIILVNISATGDPSHHAWSLKLNAVINEFATHPGVRILNWAGAVQRRPRWINHNDPLHLHLSPQGMRARANRYFGALNNLR